MLTSKITEKLNQQLNLEFFSSNLYLQMSAWCDDKGFEGAAAFLRRQSQEEMEHMLRIFTYISESNSLPLVGSIKTAPHEFKSLGHMFKEIYKHEQIVTKSINNIAHEAFDSKDLSTFNFLQWFIAEQHEEEKLFKGVLDRIEMVGEDGKALFFIDRELAEIVNQPTGSIMNTNL